MKNHAFTLLELAIVLAIVGLIAGGVVVGSNMIEAAENRSIMTDVEKYRSAAHTFKDKYGKLPGDLHNATRFWGKNNTICSGHTGTAAADGTCNGNGDENIGQAWQAESWYFWNHLSKAGMIEGKYDIYTVGGGDLEIGTHAPETAISSGSFEVENYYTYSGGVFFYDGEYNHLLRFGFPNNSACPECFNGLLSAERLWSIDDKIDDGKPGTGTVRSDKPPTGSSITSSSIWCANDDDPTAAATANYRVDVGNTACVAIFLLGI